MHNFSPADAQLGLTLVACCSSTLLLFTQVVSLDPDWDSSCPSWKFLTDQEHWRLDSSWWYTMYRPSVRFGASECSVDQDYPLNSNLHARIGRLSPHHGVTVGSEPEISA